MFKLKEYLIIYIKIIIIIKNMEKEYEEVMPLDTNMFIKATKIDRTTLETSEWLYIRPTGGQYSLYRFQQIQRLLQIN